MAIAQGPEPETGLARVEDHLILVSVGMVVQVSVIHLSTGWIGWQQTI